MKLCIAYDEYDEQGYFKREVFSDITEMKYVNDLIEDTMEIKFVSKGELYIIDYSDIEWFELVEDSHSLAHSIENNIHNDQYETISKVDDSPLLFL